MNLGKWPGWNYSFSQIEFTNLICELTNFLDAPRPLSCVLSRSPAKPPISSHCLAEEVVKVVNTVVGDWTLKTIVRAEVENLALRGASSEERYFVFVAADVGMERERHRED